jgi:D-alanyl-D-alanine carboxypeptidase (penicillin-binding protein 5/6)
MGNLQASLKRGALHRVLLLGLIFVIIPVCARAVEQEIKSAESAEAGIGGDELQLDAESAIVIDSLSGEILYEKNAYEQRFPASTTKILTALLVIEAGGLDKEVVVKESDTQAEPSWLEIKPGERFTRREMLYGVLLKSANDVAQALARDNAGSNEAFAEKMTRRARELGAKNSQFRNPHGLPDPEHYSTAYDLAVIARAAMQQPLFRRIVASVTYPWITGDGRILQLYNHNKLLRLFPGCTGLKTGWTRASQHTLVSAALRGNREVIAVVLKTNKPGVWEDSKKLLEYGLAHAGKGDLLTDKRLPGHQMTEVVSNAREK